MWLWTNWTFYFCGKLKWFRSVHPTLTRRIWKGVWCFNRKIEVSICFARSDAFRDKWAGQQLSLEQTKALSEKTKITERKTNLLMILKMEFCKSALVEINGPDSNLVLSRASIISEENFCTDEMKETGK